MTGSLALARPGATNGLLTGPDKTLLLVCALQVPVDRIRALKLHVPYVIDGVTLTLVDANHCPGAAMIVAEAPGRPPVLHCGDCR